MINLIFSTINTMAPAVAVNNPSFVVNSRTPEKRPRQRHRGGAQQPVATGESYQDEFRLSVNDRLILGHGWCKVGYKFTKPPEEKKVDAAEPDDRPVATSASTTARTPKATSSQRCTSRTTVRSSSASRPSTCSSTLMPATPRRCAGSPSGCGDRSGRTGRRAATARRRGGRCRRHVRWSSTGRRRLPQRQAQQGCKLLRDHRVLRHQAQDGVQVRP